MSGRRDTIRELQSDPRIRSECPSCGERFALKRALLFYADEPFPGKAIAILEGRKQELADRERDLKERRHRAREVSELQAVDVNLGKILEKIAPVFDGFGHNPRDCRALFEPIDYIVFRGLSEKGVVDSLTFVDVKTGGGGLNDHQRQIRRAVESSRVRWATYTVGRQE